MTTDMYISDVTDNKQNFIEYNDTEKFKWRNLRNLKEASGLWTRPFTHTNILAILTLQ